MAGAVLLSPQRASIPFVIERKRHLPASPYRAPVAGRGMVYFLAQAAREARLEAGRKQVHIAASIDRDQSMIARFERGAAWPRDVDRIIDGYADDLGISTLDLWKRALEMAQASAGDPLTEAVEAADALAPPRAAPGRKRRRSA